MKRNSEEDLDSFLYDGIGEDEIIRLNEMLRNKNRQIQELRTYVATANNNYQQVLKREAEVTDRAKELEKQVRRVRRDNEELSSQIRELSVTLKIKQRKLTTISKLMDEANLGQPAYRQQQKPIIKKEPDDSVTNQYPQADPE